MVCGRGFAHRDVVKMWRGVLVVGLGFHGGHRHILASAFSFGTSGAL